MQGVDDQLANREDRCSQPQACDIKDSKRIGQDMRLTRLIFERSHISLRLRCCYSKASPLLANSASMDLRTEDTTDVADECEDGRLLRLLLYENGGRGGVDVDGYGVLHVFFPFGRRLNSMAQLCGHSFLQVRREVRRC